MVTVYVGGPIPQNAILPRILRAEDTTSACARSLDGLWQMLGELLHATADAAKYAKRNGQGMPSFSMPRISNMFLNLQFLERKFHSSR